MFAKRIIQLSALLRRSNISTQQILAYHLTNIKKVKDNSNCLPLESVNADQLFSELNSRNPSKVLVILEANKNIIKGPHIIAALNSLIKFYKRETSDNSNEINVSWKKHNFNKEIASIIDSKINQLTGSEAIEILAGLTRLKIPVSSNVVQAILKNIYSNINDLSLIEFGTLSLIIRRLTQTPLIKNIQNALQKKFLVKFSSDLDEKNITSLENAVSFISYHFKNYNLLQRIIQSLHRYNDEIPLRSSILILESFCNMRHYPTEWLDVLHRVEDVILKNIEELNFSQINFIIYILAEKVKASKMEEFYNPDLMDELVKKLISEDAGFNNALSALRCFITIRHESKELLNYAFATYFEKTILCGQTYDDHIGKILVLTSGAAMSMHKGIFWKEIEDFITNSDEFFKYNHETLTILALNLLCLGTYHTGIIHKIFDNNYDYSKEQFLHWTFCRIYQIVKINQNDDGPVPSESQINCFKQLCHQTHKRKLKKRQELQGYLQDGLGGSVFIKSNVTTKLFHMIDHAIVFDKDGIPFPINTETSEINTLDCLEDLEVPPESQIIIVTLMPIYWYLRNSDNLIGPYKIIVDTLEAMSYKVVLIKEDTWYRIPNDKKKSFLMNEIYKVIQ